jgi:hypothetical protein
MRKQEIKTEAKSTEVAPIKGDTGGVSQINGQLMSRQPSDQRGDSDLQEVELGQEVKLHAGPKYDLSNDQGNKGSHKRCVERQPNLVRHHAGQYKTHQRAPLNPPTSTIARTLAETIPPIRDKFYLLLSALCHNLHPISRHTACFCAAQLSRQEAEIAGGAFYGVIPHLIPHIRFHQHRGQPFSVRM